jgi:hypothetical protein
MWMDSAGKKRPAGESKGQQAAIVNILLGRASSPSLPPPPQKKSFLYTARKTNYQETLNREREKNLKAPKINSVDEKREREKRLIVREQA